jgi:hypothetical protein
MICERLSFSNCFAVLREDSRKLALTVETDRVNFTAICGTRLLAECQIVTAINWVILQVFRRSSLRLRLRRGWSSLRHLPTDTESRGKEPNYQASLDNRIAYSLGEFAALFGKHQSLGYRQLYRGTVRAITQCGRIMFPAVK